MKGLRRSPCRRGLAWLLALLMVAPYLVCPRPAMAQRSTLSAYVLDFNNRTKVGGALLGRVAAAQVSLQLSDSLNWEVVPESQLQRRIQELALQPPYGREDRVQIAAGVDAAAVVYGSILDARVSTGSMPQAYVRLQVLVEDVSTGVLINGALVEGRSTPRMGYTGDADILLEEALGKAAYRAREFMDRFRLPEGTVLNTTVVGVGEGANLEALLNIGARHGVKRGMEFVVTRLRQPVGSVKIVSVDSDISTGRVIDNVQGVQPQDKVRAIFNFADFPVTRTRLRGAAEAPGTVLAAAETPAAAGAAVEGAPRVAVATQKSVLVQLRAQDPGASPSQITVDEPPPVTVDEPEVERGSTGEGGRGGGLLGKAPLRILVGGLLVMGILAVGGRAGRAATRVHGVEAAGFQSQIGAAGAFIRVTWDRPKSIKASEVLQYIVWRTDNLGTPLQIVGVSDNDANKVFLDNEAERTVSAFDGDPNSDDAGGRTDFTAPGITPGNQYRYQVATAYENGLEDRDNDGEPDDATFMSPLSSSSPWATAITIPGITNPVQGQQVQLDQLPVTWRQTPGADTYLVWISRDPNFSANRRVAFGPFRTVPVDQGGDAEITRVLDVRSPRLPSSGTVFITVGGRASADRNRPRPNGAIFSPAVQVRAETAPPPPPGTSAADEGLRKGRATTGRGDKKGHGLDRDGGKAKNRR